MTRFVVTFAPLRGTDGLRALKALLKAARRVFGLRAVKVEEAPAKASPRREVTAKRM
jgi:hypothetical protein